MNDKITILIADDNPDFANTLTGYIEEDNEFEIIAIARDGKEAVEMIISTEPDVVLLDVIMPHLDGIGVLEQINSAKMKKNPLCIMLSAVGQDKITQRALELGAEYYAIKPFDIITLLKRIKEIRLYRQQPQFINSNINNYNISNTNNNLSNYVAREIKAPYIEISPDKKKDEEIMLRVPIGWTLLH